jgi:hypothetical protein
MVTITFFHYSGFWAKWWAFTQMQFARASLSKVKGLSFFRMMGSGAGNGFSIKPDFATYAVFCKWETRAEAEEFVRNNTKFKQFSEKTQNLLTLWLEPVMAHGKWGGQVLFAEGATPELTDMIAVLTRATIRPTKLIEFWSQVPHVSAYVEGRKGLLFSKGIGEWPIMMQATVSIWQTRGDMLAFAYKDKAHADIIQRTRQRNWYKEELFSEFKVLKCTEGRQIDLEIPAHKFGNLLFSR